MRSVEIIKRQISGYGIFKLDTGKPYYDKIVGIYVASGIVFQCEICSQLPFQQFTNNSIVTKVFCKSTQSHVVFTYYPF